MESDRQMAHLTPSPLGGISQNSDQRFTLECIRQGLFPEGIPPGLLVFTRVYNPVCRFRLGIKELESIPR